MLDLAASGAEQELRGRTRVWGDKRGEVKTRGEEDTRGGDGIRDDIPGNHVSNPIVL